MLNLVVNDLSDIIIERPHYDWWSSCETNSSNSWAPWVRFWGLGPTIVICTKKVLLLSSAKWSWDVITHQLVEAKVVIKRFRCELLE